MKKVLSILAIAALTAGFVACGQSKEEKDKAEAIAKVYADSVSKALEASITNAVSDAAATETAATTETAAATTETTAPAEKK
ncbi:MAG TPA: hypothetical protein VN026_07950 [Bacteroidia bacterium]|jgi:hypothetical protein|nr:hypothetical protein [Bacteroidia bacterium]